MGGLVPASVTTCKDAGTNQYCNDVQYNTINTVANKARYERTIDTTAGGNTINSFVINGTANCSYTVEYKTAGASGVYGSVTTLSNVYPGETQTITSSNIRYVSLATTLNDINCGGQSSVTSISLSYNGAPDAPTLILPATLATDTAVLPEFRLGTTDDSNDYVRYSIEVCSTSNCSSILRTIDQTSSQTGWTSQSVQSGTAYPGGASITQYAVHQYQPTALTANTQYWWRARAIDPGGTNQWSAYSGIQSFTTGAATRTETNIGGGTTIYGGTNFSTGN